MKKHPFLIVIFLMLLAWAFASCKKPKLDVLQTLTIEKDEQRSKPWHYEWRRLSTRVYRFTFMENCLYDLPDGEQCDLMKLTGSSQQWLTNLENSHMVAYRQPDADVDSIQLSPYYHKNGITYHTEARCTNDTHRIDDEIPVIWVTTLQNFETHENVSEDNDFASFYVENLVTGEFFYWEETFPEFERCREIGWYFGGTLPAPHKMNLVRVLIGEE